MNLDFLEIGTSDFDTLIQNASATTVGVSVEPIRFYLDRLPQPPNCKKICAAISDRDDSCTVYYLSLVTIKQMGLPDWARGCNSINKYHPTVFNILKQKVQNPETYFESETVPCYTLLTFLQTFDIEEIDFLKLDTEGHDLVILNKFFDDVPSNRPLPKRIKFESNTLVLKSDVHALIAKAKKFGYKLVSTGHDTLIQR